MSCCCISVFLCAAAVLSEVLHFKHPTNLPFRLRKLLLWIHLMDLQLVCRTIQLVALHAWSLVNGNIPGGDDNRADPLLPTLCARLAARTVDATRARANLVELVCYVATATAIDCEALLVDPEVKPDATLLASNLFPSIDPTHLIKLLTVPWHAGPLCRGARVFFGLFVFFCIGACAQC
jgi:hypothetical protein